MSRQNSRGMNAPISSMRWSCSERAWGSLFNRQKAKVLLDPLLILGDDGEHVEEHTRNATTMPCPLSGGPDARDSAW